MGSDYKQPDSEQVFLDLVAAWGGLPEDEEAVKEILARYLTDPQGEGRAEHE